MVQARLAPTIREAEELVVEIIGDAGMARANMLSLRYFYMRVEREAEMYNWWIAWASGSLKMLVPSLLMGL
jgi:hypothetical protein